MIEAHEFIRAAGARGFGLYAGVPCSYLKPFINTVIDSPDLAYIGTANEGDAIAVAAGSALAGIPAVAMFQNSGLGNAVNPLTSLTHTFKVPVLIIVTLRGEPGGSPDEPQHELMGAITTRMLELMNLDWAFFPEEAESIETALDQAMDQMQSNGRSFALVMRKGSVAPADLKTQSDCHVPGVEDMPPAMAPTGTRREMLSAVQKAVKSGDLVVATTGYTGRELYALEDRPSQFYMVGSMGCAVSLGLGLALAQPRRRVLVLDGDGAALMRLGALTTVGYQRPANLVHLLLDNGVHESTGGQATVSQSVDFCQLAAAAGYTSVRRLVNPELLTTEFLSQAGPAFVHLPILPGVAADLPRPQVKPPEVARRFSRFIQQGET